MCGRYLRRSDKQRIAEAFRVGKLPDDFVLAPGYNVAPMTFQPVIRESRKSTERELVLMRWGLVPHFTKSLADVKGVSTINARAESIEKKPTLRVPFQRRRCLVLVDGFYEWLRLDAKTKQPYAFMMGDEASFAFAGLWNAWKEPDGGWLQSFSIVTTEANELMTGGAHPNAGHPVLERLWPLVEQGSDRTASRRSAAAIRIGSNEEHVLQSVGRQCAEQRAGDAQ